VAALLRRRALRWDSGWEPDLGQPTGRHPVCESCEVWLAGILASIGDGTRPSRLHGAPGTADRVLLFDDQCQVCHNLPLGKAAVLDCIAVAPGGRSWPSLLLCEACDTWLASLATDGRSLRGRIGREIDGAYGEWPHPNLRELSVETEVLDPGARATIVQSCVAMDIGIRLGTPSSTGSVLFIEARTGTDLGARVAKARAGNALVIALASMSAGASLRTALQAGAIGWLTVPSTPQQVTAALTNALRYRFRRTWDPETCLPIASLVDVARPAVVLEPARGVGRFELAWLAKRFSRGYDELVVAGGQMVLLPRVPADQLENVRLRLGELLGGRCTLLPLVHDGMPRTRFDAAG
jgi:hypothetical protein